jgi:hypothetical protein
MKIYFTTLLLSLLLNSLAHGETPVFTSLGINDKFIYAGVKVGPVAEPPDTYLLKISSSDLVAKKVFLPKELLNREVISILSAPHNEILVITQWTVEQGDKPLIHLFNPTRNSWKKMGKINCITFSKITVKKDSLIFQCIESNPKGEDIVVFKNFLLKGIALSELGEVSFPQKSIEKDNVSAQLIGEIYDWRDLKVTVVTKKEKTFKP